MKLDDLAGRRVVVWGLGAEGRAAALAAMRAGAADVTAIMDKTPDQSALDGWTSAGLTPVPVMAGDDAERSRLAAEVLLLSPGVSRYRAEVVAAEARGVSVTNGTAIFLAERPAGTVTVTGSKGKSTVTTLAAHLLGALGHDAVAAGNIGVPLLDLLEDTATDRLVVAEVSSYQAALVDRGAAVAVLTSLFPEHLPWHGDVDHYYADKFHLFTPDDPAQRTLVNADDAGVRSMLSAPALAAAVPYGAPGDDVYADDAELVVHGEPALSLRRSPLPGRHNAVNVAAAVAAIEALGIDVWAERERLEAALTGFSPLPHRLEVVATVDGVTFVDDSLATTPQAAVAACDAFADRPLVLLVGGLDRGLDYSPLTAYLEERGSRSEVAVVAMDEAGRRIAATISRVKAELCDDVVEAVRIGSGFAGRDGVVILAPAAPSPSSYGSYENRSAAFRTGIQRLHGAASPN